MKSVVNFLGKSELSTAKQWKPVAFSRDFLMLLTYEKFDEFFGLSNKSLKVQPIFSTETNGVHEITTFITVTHCPGILFVLQQVQVVVDGHFKGCH